MALEVVTPAQTQASIPPPNVAPASPPVIPPSTIGTAPLSASPSIFVEGKEWPVRRLGLLDIFAACKVFQQIFVRGGIEVASQFIHVNLKDRDQTTVLLLLGFTHVQDEMLDFMASLVGATHEEIRNPNVFPVSAAIDLMQALIDHPDASLFFSRLGEVATKAMEMAEGIAKQMAIPMDSGSSSATSSTGTGDGPTT